MSFNRLLVAHAGPPIDPNLIRYAKMVARFGRPLPPVPQAAASEFSGRREPFIKRASKRPRRIPERQSAAMPSDSEARFLTLLPPMDAFAARRAATIARLTLRTQLDQHFCGGADLPAAGCDALCGHSTGRVLSYLADFGGDLLLVGRDDWSRTNLSKLAMASPCPAWVVPTDWAPVLRRILVPIDFSQHAIGSLQAAVYLARKYSPAKCILLHVDRQETRCGDDDVAPARRSDLMAAFETVVREVDTSGVHVEPLIRKGPYVGRSIARAADEFSADLIVMTTHGRTRVARSLLPSVTAATLCEAGGAVLVLRSPGASKGWREALRGRCSGADDLLFS